MRLPTVLLAAASLLPGAALAHEAGPAREVLEQAAAAMGGLEKLEALDNVVYTGFGQRLYYQGGGNLTGDCSIIRYRRCSKRSIRTRGSARYRARTARSWSSSRPKARPARRGSVSMRAPTCRSSRAGSALTSTWAT